MLDLGLRESRIDGCLSYWYEKSKQSGSTIQTGAACWHMDDVFVRRDPPGFQNVIEGLRARFPFRK